MKTPEEILNEVAAENMISIQQMVTTKQLTIIAMMRYAKLYHDSKVKKLNILAVSGRSEQLKAIEELIDIATDHCPSDRVDYLHSIINRL